MHYPFTGFLSPVGPGLNQENAGRTIPMKWSLGGDRGMNILGAGSPTSRPASCSAPHAPTGAEEAADAPGSSGLGYSVSTQEYQFNWRTDRSWEGICREFVLRLNDGTTHMARFEFR